MVNECFQFSVKDFKHISRFIKRFRFANEFDRICREVVDLGNVKRMCNVLQRVWHNVIFHSRISFSRTMPSVRRKITPAHNLMYCCHYVRRAASDRIFRRRPRRVQFVLRVSGVEWRCWFYSIHGMIKWPSAAYLGQRPTCLFDSLFIGVTVCVHM